MPVFVPAPDCVTCEFQFALHDNYQGENVIYLLDNSPPHTVFELTALAQQLCSWYYKTIRPLQSTTLDFQGVVLRRQDSVGLGGASAFFPRGPGLLDDKGLPNNNAFRLELITSTLGQAGRGCKYVAGVPRDYVSGNRVLYGWPEQMRDAWLTLIDFAADRDWTWVVASKYVAGAARTSCLLSPVTGVSFVDNRIDSRRRRLRT